MQGKNQHFKGISFAAVPLKCDPFQIHFLDGGQLSVSTKALEKTPALLRINSACTTFLWGIFREIFLCHINITFQ